MRSPCKIGIRLRSKMPLVVHTVRLQGRPMNVKLSVELVNWNEMTYESIGGAQTNAQK